ncbi:MAG: hypothetical protein KBC84_00745 [Proteobacteria bacterium]|nr:hypothetical protein [Pseudomonadota bacterium]
MFELNEEQIEKYSRQLILPGWSARLQSEMSKITIYTFGNFLIIEKYLLGAGIAAVCPASDVTEKHNFIITKDQDIDKIKSDIIVSIDTNLGNVISVSGEQSSTLKYPSKYQDNSYILTLESIACSLMLKKLKQHLQFK